MRESMWNSYDHWDAAAGFRAPPGDTPTPTTTSPTLNLNTPPTMATKANNFILYPVVFIHTVLYVGVQILLSSLSIPRLLHQHILHDGAAAEEKYRANGAYGFVTGATDGIGKALAEELASRGVCSASLVVLLLGHFL